MYANCLDTPGCNRPSVLMLTLAPSSLLVIIRFGTKLIGGDCRIEDILFWRIDEHLGDLMTYQIHLPNSLRKSMQLAFRTTLLFLNQVNSFSFAMPVYLGSSGVSGRMSSVISTIILLDG